MSKALTTRWSRRWGAPSAEGHPPLPAAAAAAAATPHPATCECCGGGRGAAWQLLRLQMHVCVSKCVCVSVCGCVSCAC